MDHCISVKMATNYGPLYFCGSVQSEKGPVLWEWTPREGSGIYERVAVK